MVCAQPTTHVWLGRFCAQLMRLRKDVPWDAAVRRAVAAIGHAGDQAPEDAASVDAAVLGLTHPPRPPQTMGWTPTRRRASEPR